MIQKFAAAYANIVAVGKFGRAMWETIDDDAELLDVAAAIGFMVLVSVAMAIE